MTRIWFPKKYYIFLKMNICLGSLFGDDYKFCSDLVWNVTWVTFWRLNLGGRPAALCLFPLRFTTKGGTQGGKFRLWNVVPTAQSFNPKDAEFFSLKKKSLSAAAADLDIDLNKWDTSVSHAILRHPLSTSEKKILSLHELCRNQSDFLPQIWPS